MVLNGEHCGLRLCSTAKSPEPPQPLTHCAANNSACATWSSNSACNCSRSRCLPASQRANASTDCVGMISSDCVSATSVLRGARCRRWMGVDMGPPGKSRLKGNDATLKNRLLQRIESYRKSRGGASFLKHFLLLRIYIYEKRRKCGLHVEFFNRILFVDGLICHDHNRNTVVAHTTGTFCPRFRQKKRRRNAARKKFNHTNQKLNSGDKSSLRGALQFVNKI